MGRDWNARVFAQGKLQELTRYERTLEIAYGKDWRNKISDTEREQVYYLERQISWQDLD